MSGSQSTIRAAPERRPMTAHRSRHAFENRHGEAAPGGSQPVCCARRARGGRVSACTCAGSRILRLMRRAHAIFLLLVLVLAASCGPSPIEVASPVEPPAAVAALPVVPIRWASVLAVAE